MSFINCAIPNCIYQILVRYAWCRKCHGGFCYQHRSGHVCSNPKKSKKPVKNKSEMEDMYQPEVDQIMELLKPKIITAEVEHSRPGHKVKQVHVPDRWLQFAIGFYGSFNFHVKIDFENGDFWMMRIRRRKGRDYPDGPLIFNLESEVATNRILYQAGLKVPNAHLRPVDSKFHLKLIYCYQTFLAGALWRPWY
ncbi:hypothetical protein V866_005976 [Kwoniella sp. B9012]